MLSGQVTRLQPAKIAGLWNVIFLFISSRPACLTPDSYPERISADLDTLAGSDSEEVDLGEARFLFFLFFPPSLPPPPPFFFFAVIVDHSVLSVFASLGGEWLARRAQWFLWIIWEFQEDGRPGSPKTETQSPIFSYKARYFSFRVTRWQWHLSSPSSARLDMETMRDHWAGPWRLNEHVWHSTYSAESPPCSNRLRTWPPSNALIARGFDLTLLSAP